MSRFSTMAATRATQGWIPFLRQAGRNLLRAGRPKAAGLAALFLLLAGMPGRAGIQYGDFQYLVDVYDGKSVAIVSYTGPGGDVVIPSTIEGKPVTVIGGLSFFGKSNVTAVTIPLGVQKIEEAAFDGCSGLVVVDLPNTVVELGNGAFNSCTKLESVKISTSLLMVGEGAFAFCTKLKSITLPDSTMSIGYGAFEGCTSLATVNFGKGLTTLGSRVFYNCTALQKVEMPSGVTTIPYTTFSQCSGLTSVTLGAATTRIEARAFEACDALARITIPAAVAEIEDYAFMDCSGLLYAFFEGNAPAQGFAVFYNCPKATIYRLQASTGWQSTFGGRPTAIWSGLANQPPSVTSRSPAAAPAPVTEGTTVAFRLTATDATDPVVADRGMVSVTWSVDGVQKQETKTGAPNAISSSFPLKTDATTVQGTAFREIQVRAVALDKLGATTTADWTLRVNNLTTSQTITFKALPAMAPGDADFAPGATASSGLPVTYTSSNTTVAEIVDGAVHPVGTGSTVITASQPGNVDVKPATAVKQTLVVKSRVITLVPGGGGTVTGAGLYTPGTKVTLTARPLTNFTFLHWEDGSQSTSRTLALGSPVTTVTAVFKATAAISQAVITNPGPQVCTAGVAFQLPLGIDSESLPAITISGLPTGLRYDPVTRTITGVPTVPVAKKIITVTVKNANKIASVLPVEITIKALPLWAQGNFAGWFENDTLGTGTASMTVSSTGSTSGKLVFGGKTYSFTTPAFSSFEEDLGKMHLEAVAKYGTTSLPLGILLEHPQDNPDLSAGFARAGVTLTASPDSPSACMYRNTWKDADMAGEAAVYAAYYTATLSGDPDSGTGYFTFTADKTGTLQTAGKLADGTTVTSSQPLLMDETGRILTVLHTVPTTYKGGCFFGMAEFLKPDDQSPVVIQTADAGFLWESRNPLATSDYTTGGFQRNMMLEGGRYDPAIDLRTAFPDGLISGGAAVMPTQYLSMRVSDFNPDSVAEIPPKISWTEYWPVDPMGMSPDGLPITVTPATGTGTGLAAPKTHTPVKITDPTTRDWWYDYTADNSAGLTISVDRRTGKFRGSFNLYYDYVSADDHVTGLQTMTHLAKQVSFEGVLTPVRPTGTDGIAGGGFYLLPDKSSYMNQAGKDILFSYTGSHDFQLLRP